jgi:ankyrin repeat protein
MEIMLTESGWTVAFYLWPRFSKNQEDRVAFLKLLHQYGGCGFAHQASGDWTALHRAANFGTPSDISTLVRYGASVSARAGVINWAPIHYATIMGNTDVVKELARPEYNLGINVQDARGWSPLHVAAYAGAYPTLCTLLALGADAELKSW